MTALFALVVDAYIIYVTLVYCVRVCAQTIIGERIKTCPTNTISLSLSQTMRPVAQHIILQDDEARLYGGTTIDGGRTLVEGQFVELAGEDDTPATALMDQVLDSSLNTDTRYTSIYVSIMRDVYFYEVLVWSFIVFSSFVAVLSTGDPSSFFSLHTIVNAILFASFAVAGMAYVVMVLLKWRMADRRHPHIDSMLLGAFGTRTAALALAFLAASTTTLATAFMQISTAAQTSAGCVLLLYVRRGENVGRSELIAGLCIPSLLVWGALMLNGQSGQWPQYIFSFVVWAFTALHRFHWTWFHYSARDTTYTVDEGTQAYIDFHVAIVADLALRLGHAIKRVVTPTRATLAGAADAASIVIPPSNEQEMQQRFYDNINL